MKFILALIIAIFMVAFWSAMGAFMGLPIFSATLQFGINCAVFCCFLYVIRMDLIPRLESVYNYIYNWFKK